LFINIFSVNIGDWNEDSKEDEQAVLEYIRWLID
jgi:hypothetical protein